MDFKFNALIPELDVSDLQISLNFYLNVLGYKIDYERKDNKFAFISMQSSQIMIQEINGNWQTGILEKPFGRGINFQILVDSLDPVVTRLKEAKYKLFKDPSVSNYKIGNTKIQQK